MYKKIPAKCEESRVSGSLCSNNTVQAVQYTGEEGHSIYVGLCDRHSRQLLKLLPHDAKPLSIEFAERIMNNYNASTVAETTKEATSMNTAVVENTADVETAQTITITAPASGLVNLLAVAEQIAQAQPSNGNGTAQPSTVVVVDVPASPPAKPAVHVPCEKANQLLEQAGVLRAQAKLVPLIAKELEKTARDLETQAAKAQDAADKEASKPAPRALDGLPLVRLALMQCGVIDLDAVERAIDLGILSVKRHAKVVTSEDGSKETSSTPRAAVTHATSRGHSEEIKSRVVALKAQGMSDNAIGKEVGLSASTVYSMCKRAAA
jgi:hypothetical protein